MKKKIMSSVLTMILVFSLSITAMAAGGNATPKAGAGNVATADKGAQLATRARIASCLSTMTQTRAMILESKAEHIELSSQLRTKLSELKASGTSLSEETLTALTDLKSQLQAKRDALADTKGDIEALMVTYREFKQAGDLENAANTLDQVNAVQQIRYLLQTEICDLLNDMIALLAIG